MCHSLGRKAFVCGQLDAPLRVIFNIISVFPSSTTCMHVITFYFLSYYPMVIGDCRPVPGHKPVLDCPHRLVHSSSRETLKSSKYYDRQFYHCLIMKLMHWLAAAQHGYDGLILYEICKYKIYAPTLHLTITHQQSNS